METTTETKSTKMVTIQIQFIANSDEEAISVKKSVTDPITDRPNCRTTFNIIDQYGSK